MRRASIGIIFGISVILATIALALLSREAIRADQARATLYEATRQARMAEAQANRAMERRDLIGRAVWRLDTMLTPLVAQESTRPADLYLPKFALPISGIGNVGHDPEATPSQQVDQSSSRSATDPAQTPPSRTPTSRSPASQAEAYQSTESQPDPLAEPLLDLPNEYVALHFQVDALGTWTSPQVPLEIESTSAQSDPQGVRTRREFLEMLARTIDVNQLQRMVPDQQIQVESSNLFEMNSLEYAGVSQNVDIGNASAYRDDSLRKMASQQPAQDASSFQSREFRDWDLRNRLFENFANTSLRNQRLVLNQSRSSASEEVIREGVTRPIWMKDQLILVRRWDSPLCGSVIQGCCLNWPRLKARLQRDIQDLIPDCDLVPVYPDSVLEPTQLLATLPIQLAVPESEQPAFEEATPFASSGLTWMLSFAWIGLLLSAVAGAVVIVQTQSLAARRAQFVSSVTHELRTPLTTFRMYTEMLDLGMVPPGESYREYLSTLRREAERLNHLVDNVLAFARLEHSRRRRRAVEVDLSEFVTGLEPRLHDRAKLAEMSFEIRRLRDSQPTSQSLGKIMVDPLSVEQILFNLVDNACKYGRKLGSAQIEIEVDVNDDRWRVSVMDRGPGVAASERHRLFRLFSKTDHEAAVTAPGIGLGLALSRRLARELGGQLDYRDREGGGAMFTLVLPRSA